MPSPLFTPPANSPIPGSVPLPLPSISPLRSARASPSLSLPGRSDSTGGRTRLSQTASALPLPSAEWPGHDIA